LVKNNPDTYERLQDYICKEWNKCQKLQNTRYFVFKYLKDFIEQHDKTSILDCGCLAKFPLKNLLNENFKTTKKNFQIKGIEIIEPNSNQDNNKDICFKDIELVNKDDIINLFQETEIDIILFFNSFYKNNVTPLINFAWNFLKEKGKLIIVQPIARINHNGEGKFVKCVELNGFNYSEIRFFNEKKSSLVCLIFEKKPTKEIKEVEIGNY
jgi:SAM-dependent methyltransferase